MLDPIPLDEALQDPEALPTITECLNAIYAAAQDMHTDLNFDRAKPMGLADPTQREAIADYAYTIINALDDIAQWGDEIIDHAEQNM